MTVSRPVVACEARQRGAAHSPNVQSMVEMLAAGSKAAGSKLSGLKLPIGGLAEPLKRVQPAVLRRARVGAGAAGLPAHAPPDEDCPRSVEIALGYPRLST